MAETQAQTLERFFRTLVEAARTRRSAGVRTPLTVAEIYEDLLPYRLARREVGFEMNGDYEHALMLLLAGEGDFVQLAPSEAQRELRRELESAHPDVSLYRKFAGCDVWLQGDPRPQTPVPSGPGGDAANSPRGAASSRGCPSCGDRLPSGRDVRFCPFCGEPLATTCPGCGAASGPGWSFCTVCGRRAGA